MDYWTQMKLLYGWLELLLEMLIDLTYFRAMTVPALMWFRDRMTAPGTIRFGNAGSGLASGAGCMWASPPILDPDWKEGLDSTNGVDKADPCHKTSSVCHSFTLQALLTASALSLLLTLHLSNHGQGHDFVVDLRLSCLLEGDDCSGGEEPARLQPQTALLWETGAQISRIHDHKS